MAKNEYEYKITYSDDEGYSESEYKTFTADDEYDARTQAHDHVEAEGYANFGEYEVTLIDVH